MIESYLMKFITSMSIVKSLRFVCTREENETKNYEMCFFFFCEVTIFINYIFHEEESKYIR